MKIVSRLPLIKTLSVLGVVCSLSFTSVSFSHAAETTVPTAKVASHLIKSAEYDQIEKNLSQSLPKSSIERKLLEEKLSRLKTAFRNIKDGDQLAVKQLYNTQKMLPGTILISLESRDMVKNSIYRFGHAAIVSTDPNVLLEAPGLDLPLQKTNVAEWLKDKHYWVAFAVDGAKSDDYQKAATYAEKQVNENKHYIPTDAFDRFFTKKGKLSEASYYCSSLVWHSWFKQGFDLDPDAEDGTVWPKEILTDPDVVPIATSLKVVNKEIDVDDSDFFSDYLQNQVMSKSIDLLNQQKQVSTAPVQVPIGAQLGIYAKSKSNAPVLWKVLDPNGKQIASGTLTKAGDQVNFRKTVPVGTYRLYLEKGLATATLSSWK